MPVLSSSLLIYSGFDSPRLQYVLQWIFEEQLGTAYRVTTSTEEWMAFEGPRINYSKTPLVADELQIVPHALLGESDIRTQSLAVQRWKHSTILFYNQPGAAIPFDLFAAAFYLISRYEEYLPHKEDRHGRYEAAQSAAAQYSFLQEPVVDQWIGQLRRILVQRFQLPLSAPSFRFQPSYDVDIAWKYRHRGIRHYWGGMAKELLQVKWRSAASRLAAGLTGGRDPYDCFAWLDALHERYRLAPLYFFLAGSGSRYDRNVLPGTPAMQQLMRHISERYTVGVHPSYLSHTNPSILSDERGIVSVYTHQEITRSRQHYIKFGLPHTYRELMAAGITDDYSMGYAMANGFRAGTSNAFTWYDLEAEAAYPFRVHPFIFMDATSRFYLRHKPGEAWQEWERLWHAVQQVGGTFTSIMHNHLLGPARENKGWGEMYRKALAQNMR
ncbi:polysaccharide deacetylase family protein [Taibaiella koreensis]|uniref:polysaccharide deacetylase family protein n=1 Tax=Taibaiella koreensis TaxID=1268548 RepID=UPI0013C34108|nr:polysaccharide deacetylase family protein [Taibaiella koreensis]